MEKKKDEVEQNEEYKEKKKQKGKQKEKRILNEKDKGKKDKGKKIEKVTDEVEMPLIECEPSEFSKATEVESKVASWIFSFEGDKSDVVFETKDGFQSMRFMMESLIPECETFYNVIDTWAMLLNFEERMKSEDCPRRFFAQQKSLHGQIQDLEKFELVFFPVVSVVHYLLICFNLKEGRIQIFDNSDVDVPLSAKYGSIPIVVQKVFVTVLKQLNDGRFKKLNKAKPKREKMSWRTLGNHVDCAVFMMRHMETYMGQSMKDWDCGLADEGKTQKSQLVNLRHKYVGKMLLSDLNVKKNLVLEGMHKFAEYPEQKQKEILDYAKTMVHNRFNEFAN
ncbi:hypothetical protein OSB04_015903 [Centaurea solstitialis]|uniref:Ubiquitin-like protease family profile domain-containing protein n=1 Tax=Centaurea solstitialis TaxID=347529 RepID=A0AA38TJW5_9ASTR|nr:hypothetical protein OSB04_015903 [Centaurea solstitialis]